MALKRRIHLTSGVDVLLCFTPSNIPHIHTSTSGCRSPSRGQDPLRCPFPNQPLLGGGHHRGPPHLQVRQLTATSAYMLLLWSSKCFPTDCP